MHMTLPEIESAIKTLTILVDTREKPTDKFQERMKLIGLPWKRQKLDYGDYSACVYDSEGNEINLTPFFSIERKMSIDEIAQNLTRGRSRFAREFTRATENGAKMYILIEDASWEKILSGKYRTKVHPNALSASLATWMSRYNANIIMCKCSTSPSMIRSICKSEAKRALEELSEKDI